MERRESLRWLLIAVLLLVLAARLFVGQRQDASLQRVQQAGVLIVALDASYPPFETTDGQGNFSGFDVDLAREIAHRLGVQVQFANIAYDSLYDALVARRADVVISGLRYEAERTRDVIYTTPYFDAGHVLIVRAGDAITRPTDLAGRGVAVETASEGEVVARKLAAKTQGMHVVEYPLREDGVVALRRGEVDAVVTDHISALALARGQPDLRLMLPPVASDPLVAAGHIHDRTLMNEINRIIKALHDEGVLDRLVSVHF